MTTPAVLVPAPGAPRGAPFFEVDWALGASEIRKDPPMAARAARVRVCCTLLSSAPAPCCGDVLADRPSPVWRELSGIRGAASSFCVDGRGGARWGGRGQSVEKER